MRYYIHLLPFMAGLLFCLSCAVLYGSLNYDKAVFADYQQVGKIGNCEVFLPGTMWSTVAVSLTRYRRVIRSPVSQGTVPI
jgi:hypothetical protein